MKRLFSLVVPFVLFFSASCFAGMKSSVVYSEAEVAFYQGTLMTGTTSLSLTSGTSMQVLIDLSTVTVTTDAYLEYAISVDSGATVYVYANPTITSSGTAVNLYSSFRASTNGYSSKIRMFERSTVTSSGTLLETQYIPMGGGVLNGVLGCKDGQMPL